MIKICFRVVFYYFILGLILLFLLCLITPIYGSAFVADILSRHNINDSYISSYYLFWTTFSYLPEFFFVLIFFVCYQLLIIQFVTFAKLLLLFIFFNHIYVTELLDFIPINYSADIINCTDNTSNVLLLNMLNRYHPFIFYISVTLFIVVVFILNLRSFSLIDSFLTNYTLLNIKYINLHTFSTNFIALWLGGWWAFQEGTWGGWWNSDISEMLGLTITVTALTFFHIYIFSREIHMISFFFYSSFLVFLTLYYFIQINYELTSHNFGARFFFFFNNNLLLLELIFILILIMVFLVRWRFRLVISTSYLFIEIRSVFVYFKKMWLAVQGLLWFSWCLWLLLSLLPLIDSFTQNYIHVADINFYKLYKFSQVVFLLFLMSVVFTLRVHTIVTYVAFVFCFPYTIVLTVPLYLEKFNWVILLHILISLFVALNIFVSNLSFLYWGFNNGYTTFYTSGNLYLFYTSILVCDSDNFNEVFFMTSGDQSFISSWTTTTMFSNSTDIDSFGLVFNCNSLFNYFYFITDWIHIFILIESVDTSTLSFLLLIALLLVLIKLWSRYDKHLSLRSVY